MLESRRVRIALRWSIILVGLSFGSAALLILYGTALVDKAMEASRQGSFSVIRSAPLVLRDSDDWKIEQLRRALGARGFSESKQQPNGSEFMVESHRIWLGQSMLPDLGKPLTVEFTPAGVQLVTSDQIRLRQIVFRGIVISTGVANDTVRWPLRLDDMSPHLKTAVVDVEDRDFLNHAGLSFRGLLRAAVRDLFTGGVKQGGSTITQQLAKVLILKPSRTLPRKVVEAWLAALLEYRYDKRTILEAYLNRIYLGQDGGWQILGMGAASHFYFGKKPAELAIEEAALLAGLIAAPNRFDPFVHPDAAKARRTLVLNAMSREGHLSETDALRLSQTPLPLQPRHFRWPPAAQITEYIGTLGKWQGELQSTVDVDVHSAVAGGCEAGLKKIESRFPKLNELAAKGDPLQVAAVAMTPDGRILAIQGSRKAQTGEFNRAIAARRPIGSLAKPFTAVTAFQNGWTAESELADEPLSVPVGRDLWEPKNNDGKFRGPVSIREALVQSLNVPMVRLGLDVGVGAVADSLRRAGFTVGQENPSLLLGAFEACPVDVARAYGVFAAEGRLPGLRVDANQPYRSAAIFDPVATAEVRRVLEEVVSQGTGATLASSIEGRLAAKTGTTDDRRDSWFVGVRPRLILVVWVGTDGNRETGLYGATGALEIWREIDARLPSLWRIGSFAGE